MADNAKNVESLDHNGKCEIPFPGIPCDLKTLKHIFQTTTSITAVMDNEEQRAAIDFHGEIEDVMVLMGKAIQMLMNRLDPTQRRIMFAVAMELMAPLAVKKVKGGKDDETAGSAGRDHTADRGAGAVPEGAAADGHATGTAADHVGI